MASSVSGPAHSENHELLRIGSKRVDTASWIEIRDPATGTVVGTCANASAADVTAAIDAAYTAYKTWGRTTPGERASVLHRLGESLTGDESVLASLVTSEVGKPLIESRAEVAYAAEFAHWYAEEARRVYGRVTVGGADEPWRQLIRQPIGVVGAITPWNYPLVLSARKIFAAIAAGCTVVLKPSELAPLAAFRLGMLAEHAGLPDGVLNIVTADPPAPVGDMFSSDPRVRKISFTGSVKTGKRLMHDAATTLTKIGLELGGNNAFIVFEDADLDAAVAAAVVAKLRNGGQTCVCANRYLVHGSLLEEFTARFADVLSGKAVGSGFDPANEIGPLVDQQAVDRVHTAVNEAIAAGATVVCGGPDATAFGWPEGPFYPPTVLLGVDLASKLMTEEIFGPVAPIVSFRDFSEVIEMANDTEYGLAAYVFTRNLRTAMRASEELETGIVVVNRAAPTGVEFPQGGVKQSGSGLEGGPEGLAEFTTSKFITLGN